MTKHYTITYSFDVENDGQINSAIEQNRDISVLQNLFQNNNIERKSIYTSTYKKLIPVQEIGCEQCLKSWETSEGDLSAKPGYIFLAFGWVKCDCNKDNICDDDVINAGPCESSDEEKSRELVRCPITYTNMDHSSWEIVSSGPCPQNASSKPSPAAYFSCRECGKKHEKLNSNFLHHVCDGCGLKTFVYYKHILVSIRERNILCWINKDDRPIWNLPIWLYDFPKEFLNFRNLDFLQKNSKISFLKDKYDEIFCLSRDVLHNFLEKCDKSKKYKPYTLVADDIKIYFDHNKYVDEPIETDQCDICASHFQDKEEHHYIDDYCLCEPCAEKKSDRNKCCYKCGDRQEIEYTTGDILEYWICAKC